MFPVEQSGPGAADAEAETIDPQAVAAMAINDVLDLARVMSAKGLSRGHVEMRRRLQVMDLAMAQAERAGVLRAGDAIGATEGSA